jgi:hypothetical protein
MKTFKAKAGPFAERTYYEDAEVEAICSDELAKLSLLPAQPQAIRIERFVEKRFVPPRYEDLGQGMLGMIKFSAAAPSGVSEIVVSSQLDEERGKVSERRIRTTLAHEGGHGLLHTHLFVLNADSSKRPLFGDFSEPDRPKILCRSEYKGEWWEFQANKAMACLLLPKRLIDLAIEPYLTKQGQLGLRALDRSSKSKAERELSELFDVNPVVVRLRLEQLYPEMTGGQLAL